MSLAANFKMMSLYNQRINRQLMDCCLSLPRDSLLKETDSFFPNIVSYWNHILFGDLILLGRLAKNNIAKLDPSDFIEFPIPTSPRDLYYADLSELKLIRNQLDALIIRFCEDLTEADCDKFITYQTTEGQTLTKAVSDVTQHIFNHQTHHRGQLTCILSQLGIDYGCMDLPMIVPEGSRK